MLASADVVMLMRDMPESTPNKPASANSTTLVLSNDQPARASAAGLPPEPRRIAPYDVRMSPRWTIVAIAAAATNGNGTHGIANAEMLWSHWGALPPGLRSIRIARPCQTKLMPSVTTIEGRFRT